jgi:hypothetical protein
MKPANEEETKLKKYLSMKNLTPSLNPNSSKKLGIHPVNEVRASMEFVHENSSNRVKKKDNIFFEEFSEDHSKKGRDSNKMSATSFKKKSNTPDKELSPENKSIFSKSYSDFSGSDNRQLMEDKEENKRKMHSHKIIPTDNEKFTLKQSREIKSNKRIAKITPKRTSIRIEMGEKRVKNDLYNPQHDDQEPFGSAQENINLIPPGKDYITFTEIKKNTPNPSKHQFG